jgi:hypothetical protein
MATAVSCHPAAATWWPHSQQRQSQITQQLENILLLMQFYINNIRKISLFMMMTCSTRRWPPVPGCGRGRTAEHWCAPPPLPRVLRTILPIAASGHVRGASMATDAMSGDRHPAEVAARYIMFIIASQSQVYCVLLLPPSLSTF